MNMTSRQIRQAFLDYFEERGHQIVPSAPMVIKNDPTLMFTNAGMNQFKDIFLGNAPAKYPRAADTQKCLRVSGKHNDLEEVGVDTYHHTMFEMLGNWSFGDYFKTNAIEWAWDLLTRVYGIEKDRLYVTVFEGDKSDGLAKDSDAEEIWKQFIDPSRILMGNKKDNFWEMGDTGPCGPCSEIHVDLRDDAERAKTPGADLVNNDHPQVIEIWNNVFMEFNRKTDGSLEKLPAQHVDTGMGFERLCMALQGVRSNYDTDVFTPMINFISEQSGIPYKKAEQTDIAMRVIADHVRAIAFAIADGQLPSNNKAGYVIRRILRRAVRYAYTFLGFKEAFMYKLMPILAEQFDGVFPELVSQQDFISRVIHEEENSFLRTLGVGIQRFDSFEGDNISGEFAFELYDTFGFPVDLTQLLAREQKKSVDMNGFNAEMEKQKNRSRAAAVIDTEDWITVREGEETEFIGYDLQEADVEILRYRKVKAKNKEQFQIVLNRTPFYAESGGQVGDTGTLTSDNGVIRITDTKKENNLIVHFTDKLPLDPSDSFEAKIDAGRRKLITSNHSATHLMHSALREVLGNHVAQKGSLVNEELTRFDFSHFAKVTDEELKKIEQRVNEKIRENILLDERRNVPIEDAMKLGATALFGEKYGDYVRVITFDPAYSRELCGGTHVKATGEIGLFKFVSESSVAAGVRRVEAITSSNALNHFEAQEKSLQTIAELLKAQKDVVKAVENVISENENLRSVIQTMLREKARSLKKEITAELEEVNGINFASKKIELPSAEEIKNLCFELRQSNSNLMLVLGAEIDGKPHLSVLISDDLVKTHNLDASKVVRELAKHIQGGGGGQAFYANAGGKDISGLDAALSAARNIISN